jgi:hypothetical protein
MKTVTVEIPRAYLLYLATYEAGNIAVWAKEECVKHGIQPNVETFIDENLDSTRTFLEEVLGPEFMSEVDLLIDRAMKQIKE